MSRLSQPELEAAVAARLEEVEALPVAEGAGVAAVVVVKDVDPGAFARGAVEFAARLEPGLASAWRRNFTRTIFLAGDPGRIAGRHAADLLGESRELGWFVPAPVATRQGLRRLLKAFDAPALPVGMPAVSVNGGTRGSRWRLYVDVTGIGMAAYLVHVHHLLCEATLTGLLAPEDDLEVLHVGPIEATTGPFARVRTGREDGDKGHLRLYAALVEGRAA